MMLNASVLCCCCWDNPEVWLELIPEDLKFTLDVNISDAKNLRILDHFDMMVRDGLIPAQYPPVRPEIIIPNNFEQIPWNDYQQFGKPHQFTRPFSFGSPTAILEAYIGNVQTADYSYPVDHLELNSKLQVLADYQASHYQECLNYQDSLKIKKEYEFALKLERVLKDLADIQANQIALKNYYLIFALGILVGGGCVVTLYLISGLAGSATAVMVT